METTLKVLDSLHRPFHRPLWIVKWVCYFINQRGKKGCSMIRFKDTTTDLYFFLLELFHDNYPQDNDGIPSYESISEAWSFFSQFENEKKEIVLKEILSKEREKGVETKIYSTYKAASYYLNLASNKLHFINEVDKTTIWKPSQLTKAVLKSGISESDRKIYLRQIIQYDGHFFLAMSLLLKPIKKYNLKIEEEVFKFMQRYYPVTNFDYTAQSHSNYYVVRKRWQELLKVANDKGTLSRALTNIIKKNNEYEAVFLDVNNKVKSYCSELQEKSAFLKNKKKFISTYQNLAQKGEDKSNFVNLYDISKEMGMSYQRFQGFLSRFYQEERMIRNIFFINIVSTIEQRKRFYIGKSPVMKIKMTKYYGV